LIPVRFNTLSVVFELGVSLPISSAQTWDITAFTVRIGVINRSDTLPPEPFFQFVPPSKGGVSVEGLHPPRLIGVLGVEAISVEAKPR
jgi:hypothetical protein